MFTCYVIEKGEISTRYITTSSEQFLLHLFTYTRMHSSRMRTAHFSYRLGWRSLPRGGGVCLGGLPSGCLPHTHTHTHTHTHPVNRMTDRCKNTTLPQTSFAAGNNRYVRGPSKTFYVLRPKKRDISRTALSSVYA